MGLRSVVGLAAVAIALVPFACSTHTAPARPQREAASSSAPEAGPASQPQAEASGDAFATRVRPVLSRRCAPCHEPGGKMYERLPFDQPEVVASRAEGVLRRLTGEDRATVAAWLDGARGAARPAP